MDRYGKSIKGQVDCQLVRLIVNFAETMLKYRYGIFSWYDHKVSSEKLERTNNKIKVMKRTAYKYRDMDFFKLKILSIHETKYALI